MLKKAGDFAKSPEFETDGVSLACRAVRRNQQTLHRIFLQHSLEVNGNNIPLTEVRTVLDANGRGVVDEWVQFQNIPHDMMNDDLSPVMSNQSNQGIMIHTRVEYLETLAKLVQDQIKSFGENLIVKKDAGGSQVAQVLHELAEIHYLLAHAAFDWRGSAAKSELLVRGLAVSAHVELPAFKRGFVPDLEAFFCTKDEFVSKYVNAFDGAALII